jgi:hypothetical protein
MTNLNDLLEKLEALDKRGSSAPWRVAADSMGGFNRIWTEVNGSVCDVASCSGDGSLWEHEKANEQLIAESRNSLPVLIALVREMTDGEDPAVLDDYLESAIEKAGGHD